MMKSTSLIPLLLFFSTQSVASNILNELNSRYLNTTSQCDNETPAYYCSGVMLRATENNDSRWDSSTENRASFTYLREDIDIKYTFRGNGYIVLPQESAIEQGSPLDYHCAFPHEGMTNSRAQYTEGNDLGEGCSTFLSGVYYKSCLDANVSDIPSLINYIDQNNVMDNYIFNQCAYNTKNAESFLLSIQAHNLVPSYYPDNNEVPFPDGYNEILTDGWISGSTLPIEAFYYSYYEEDDTKTQNGRNIALSDRNLYYQSRGPFLPVVAIDMNKKVNPFISEE